MKKHVQILIENLKKKHRNIYVIVSPPRCSSTALARVFWQDRSIRFYSHEPFEATYYLGENIDDVFRRLESPLDLQLLGLSINRPTGKELVIKEMPYQVGANFPILAFLTTKPLIFLIRDPRLSIFSRMEKKKEVGGSPFFPLIETGWEIIFQQIGYCRDKHIPYLILDSSEFRDYPLKVFPRLYAKIGLRFSSKQLLWQSIDDVDLDNLGGRHTHLYKRALLSNGIQAAKESIPSIKAFPVKGGFRSHVIKALRIYNELRNDPGKIRIR